jgi:hypothetical protein
MRHKKNIIGKYSEKKKKIFVSKRLSRNKSYELFKTKPLKPC